MLWARAPGARSPRANISKSSGRSGSAAELGVKGVWNQPVDGSLALQALCSKLKEQDETWNDYTQHLMDDFGALAKQLETNKTSRPGG